MDSYHQKYELDALIGGMSNTVGSSDGVRARSWGCCDKSNILQQDDRSEANIYTYFYSTGAEFSPFSPYRPALYRHI